MNVFELEASLSLKTDEYERALEDAERKGEYFESAVERMGSEADSTKADIRQLGNAVERVGGEADSTKSDMGQLADGIDEAGSAAGQADGDMDALAAAMESAALKGNLLTSAIETGIGFISDFASEVWNLDEATEDYRVSQAKLTTAFESNGYNAETAKAAYKELYAVLGDMDQATEASQLLAKLATSTADFADWGTIAAGVAGSFGDALPIESLIESANETAKVGQVTGTLADALNWAGISEEQFNEKLAECAGTEERTALITSTLTQEYSGAAAAFERNSAAIMANREAQLQLTEAQAGAGAEVGRLKTALTTMFTPAAEKVLEVIERWAGGLANAAEEHNELRRAFANPLPTTSIEEAEAALAEMVARYDELSAMAPETFTGAAAAEYAALGNQIAFAEEQLADMRAEAEMTAESLAMTGESGEAMAAALETIEVSANGVTVALQGTGLSAEEAQTRLQTYTSAAQNMFSAINTESSLSYEQAVGNLEANAQATRDFATNMESIVGVLPPQLAEMLSAGGAAMYAGVVAMLAEANAGADEGLTQLNEAFADSGAAGAEAFIASLTGSIPADAETPITIMTQQMNADTSMEQAGAAAVGRTSTAMYEAVQLGGFRSAGDGAMVQFALGMESRRPYVVGTAQSIAQQAASILQQAMNSINLAGQIVNNAGAGSARAGGLDYVPYNDYPVRAHRGEAILTASEAEDWRAGKARQSSGGVTYNNYFYTAEQSPVEIAAQVQRQLEIARWT